MAGNNRLIFSLVFVFIGLIVFSALPVSAANLSLWAHVVNASSGASLSGASVSYIASGVTYPGGSTDSYGLSQAVVLQANQSVSITVSKAGYQSKTQSYTMLSYPNSQVVTISLVPSAPSTVSVRAVVKTAAGSPVSGASVTIGGTSAGTTSSDGYSQMVSKSSGSSVSIVVSKPGYQTKTQSYTVLSSPSVQPVNITLSPVTSSNKSVWCHVVNSSTGANLSGAAVSFVADGVTYPGGSTDSYGLSTAVILQPGQVVSVSVSKSGFSSKTQSYTVSASTNSQVVEISLVSSAPQANSVIVKARAVVGGISQTPLSGASMTYLVGLTTYPGGITDSQGYGSQAVTLQSGQSFQVKVEKAGYTTVISQTFSVPSSGTTYSPTVSLALPSASNISVKAKVLVGGVSQVPLANASVTYLVGNASYPGQLTDSQGFASPVTLQPGQVFQVRVEKSGYTTVVSQSFTVPSTSPYNPVVSMAIPNASNIVVKARVVVGGISQTPLGGASVTYTADGEVYPGGITDSSGYANPVVLQPGQSVLVNVRKAGYTSVSQTFFVPSTTPYSPVISLAVPGGSDSNELFLTGSAKVRVFFANGSFDDETVSVGESFAVTGAGSYANQGLRVLLSQVSRSTPSGLLIARFELYDSLNRVVNIQNVSAGSDIVFQSATGVSVVLERLHVEAINSSSPGPASNCVANASKSCVNNDLFWFDSCGHIGERFLDCGSNETCSTAPPACVQNVSLQCGSSGTVSSVGSGKKRIVLSNPNGVGVQYCSSGSAACATQNMVCEGIESRATTSENWVSSSIACSRITPLASLGTMVYSAICKPSTIVTSKIRAKVFDYSANSPLSGASVILIANGTTYNLGTTNFDGYSSFTPFIAVGSSYTMVVSKNGFASLSRAGTIRPSSSGQTRYFRLNPLAVSDSVVRSRIVTTPSGYPVNAVRVTFSWTGHMDQVVLTNSDGYAQVSIPRGQEFTVKVEGSGIGTVERSYIVPSASPTFDFVIPVTVRP